VCVQPFRHWGSVCHLGAVICTTFFWCVPSAPSGNAIVVTYSVRVVWLAVVWPCPLWQCHRCYVQGTSSVAWWCCPAPSGNAIVVTYSVRVVWLGGVARRVVRRNLSSDWLTDVSSSLASVPFRSVCMDTTHFSVPLSRNLCPAPPCCAGAPPHLFCTVLT
jgi:hypothetical protein